MQTIPRVLATVLLLIALKSVATADSYSALMDSFVADSSGQFSRGVFDFGHSFSHIDSVSVEVVVPDGWPDELCAGSNCSFSSIELAIHSPEHQVDFSGPQPAVKVYYNPDVIRFSILSAYANQLLTPRFLPQNLFEPVQWPGFLFSGAGVVDLQQVDVRACEGFCTGFSSSRQAATEVALLRLVIEGVATPEPGTSQLLAAVAVFGILIFPRNPRRF
jgi:hypothetical protein